MQVIQQSFAHSSSSLIMSKMMGTIQDIIGSPLSSAEVTTSIILASVTRGFLISIISSVIFYLFLDLEINNYIIFIIYLFLGTFIGFTRLYSGLLQINLMKYHDYKFSNCSFILFVWNILFIKRLPDFQTISYYNLFSYDYGFRYSYINQMDGSLKFGIVYLSILGVIR